MKRILLITRNPFEAKRSSEITKDVFDSYYNNTGNVVFAHGISRILGTPENHISYPCEKLSVSYAERINEEFDHVVISSANLLSPDWLHFIEMYAEFLPRIKIPCTYCAIGSQSDIDYDKGFVDKIKKPAHKMLSSILDRGPWIGVRGEFTKDIVSRLGFSNHVRVIGCPSYFMRGEEFLVKERDKTLPVAFNDTPLHRNFLFDIAKKNYEQSVYITQDYVDCEGIDWVSARLILDRKIHMFGNYLEWSTFLEKCSLSISTRIHGTIMSLLSGTPAFLFTIDSRTRELAELLGIPHLEARKAGQDLDSSKLMDHIDVQLINKKYHDLLENFKSFLDDNKLQSSLDSNHVDTRLKFDQEAAKNFSGETVDVGLIVRQSEDICRALINREEENFYKAANASKSESDQSALSRITRKAKNIFN